MTRALLDGLAGRADVDVVHLNTQVSRSLAEKGGHSQLRKSMRNAVQWVRLIISIVRFRPDIVYLPLTNSPSFLGFLRDAGFILTAQLLGPVVMIRLHGGYYYYAQTTGAKRRFVAFTLRNVKLAMVQGNRLRDVFNDLVPPEKVAVVPNGLDAQPFQEALEKTSGDPSRPIRILFVGLMCEEKGFETVIEAMPMVADAEFVFLGEWASQAIRERVTARLRCDDTASRARFPGVVSGPAKYEWYARSDVFVFPTYFVYEGHAVSSVEALAAGLPIVCTNHGALDESVRDGWNGFFVPAKDPGALAEKLAVLVEDATLRRTMAGRSRELFEERFTIDRFVENWTEAVRSGFAQQVQRRDTVADSR